MSQGSKVGKGGAGSKGKKSGAEEKREDVLQAVIIADSFQDRFAPFTVEKPRCLLPLANTPLIEYTLEFLAMNGVQEVYIYCGKHTEQVENYIYDSRWATRSKSSPFSFVEFVRVQDAHSIGDFLRDLDTRGLIASDFVLVHGDLVANISLDAALAAHKARKEANRDSIMTMVLRSGGVDDHRTKMNAVTPVFVIDPTKKQCLHYEEITPLQSDRYVNLDPEFLRNREIEIRSDLIDASVDICTPDVLALWSESFDYELPRKNFLHGVLKDWELNGKMIHAEIVDEGYAARASNLQMYESISRDILSRWAYPFTPDSNILPGQTYRLWRTNVYKEDGVRLAHDSKVSKSILGKGTQIGPGSRIRNSFIGRHCKIGADVTVTDSVIWDHTVIDDYSKVEHALVADNCVIGKNCKVIPGSLLSFGVHVSDDTTIPPFTNVSLLDSDGQPVDADPSVVGSSGKGAAFNNPEDDELEEDDPARFQKPLIYTLAGANLSSSTISTLASDDDDLSDTDTNHLSVPTTADRSRHESFASDDSGTGRSSLAFHTDAVHGLLDALRDEGGDFDSARLEFTGLRLSNNASDTALRRAVATAFVRRTAELMTPEHGSLDASKAARSSVTSQKGASKFISEVGVGSGDVSEQVDFIIALQKACVSALSPRGLGLDTSKAGLVLAALLQQLYETDVLEEEGVLSWWADERSKGEGEKSDGMIGVREGVQKLVEWFEQASEEESEEEDSDDE